MTQPRSELIGRQAELDLLAELSAQEDGSVVVVAGPSGVGKTKLVESFADSAHAKARYPLTISCSLYRTNWTSALAQMKRGVPRIPANATQEELEAAIFTLARKGGVLLVLDNVDNEHVQYVEEFIERWQEAASGSLLLITAQTDVRAVIPADIPDLLLEGLRQEDDILALLGGLRSRLPVGDLVAAAEKLSGNPQLLLFMRWREPGSVAELEEMVDKLADRNLAQAVEDLVDQTSLPTLFFLALGVHKDTSVSQRLLAALWDHFGSRGAEPFIRSIQMLVDRQFLAPTTPGDYRLHEQVHVNLEKALVNRVGRERVPSLHHYFAEYYRRGLHHSPTSTAFTRFVHHARLAGDLMLIYHTLIDDKIVDRLASSGMVLQVQQELESLAPSLADSGLRADQLVRLYVALGRLCNALSDHDKALSWMEKCAELADRNESAATTNREIWYVSAVAYSNTGQSDSCLQSYFRIVEASIADEDTLGCVSLGYLAHDLKYRDIDEADRLGQLSVDWARSFQSGVILAKNLCSHAETTALLGRLRDAKNMYREAEAIATFHEDKRELGRIRTNWGLAEMLSGSDGLQLVESGMTLSHQLGDRRRSLQGTLYQGVLLARAGQRARARASILQAAKGFGLLHDGRYFAPAVLWLLQVDGVTHSDLWAGLDVSVLRPDTRALAERMQNHPGYRVYADFWHRSLSACIPPRPNGRQAKKDASYRTEPT
ncbi:AAA family ATPase [Amycolatopsis mongoliensis]|uniref:AAA family ATPase n=1 Tax=Amycolatopsis mongoliensis TaxID=715475 RepID=A0A9Y2JYI1_9PSEU|nr:AAA family ATPase [Amycolatopsis sp. 4-36]WIY07091.1 AAA family ATPase [Amycolatopsis sp. 4-36]